MPQSAAPLQNLRQRSRGSKSDESIGSDRKPGIRIFMMRFSFFCTSLVQTLNRWKSFLFDQTKLGRGL